MYVAAGGRRWLDIARLLLRAGADPDERGRGALAIAEKSWPSSENEGHDDVAALNNTAVF